MVDGDFACLHAKLPGGDHRQLDTIYHRLVTRPRGFHFLVGSCMFANGVCSSKQRFSIHAFANGHHFCNDANATNRLLSVDAITAAIAHELRTPLGAISLNCQYSPQSAAFRTLRKLEEMDEILTDIDAESPSRGCNHFERSPTCRKTTPESKGTDAR